MVQLHSLGPRHVAQLVEHVKSVFKFLSSQEGRPRMVIIGNDGVVSSNLTVARLPPIF